MWMGEEVQQSSLFVVMCCDRFSKWEISLFGNSQMNYGNFIITDWNKCSPYSMLQRSSVSSIHLISIWQRDSSILKCQFRGMIQGAVELQVISMTCFVTSDCNVLTLEYSFDPGLCPSLFCYRTMLNWFMDHYLGVKFSIRDNIPTY